MKLKLKQDEAKHPFSTDRAISMRSEDLLGRDHFSEHVASAISNWKEKDSLVLSICGRWGDGKTSVKNMILEVLTAYSETERPKVVEFNPWQWQDEKSLTEAFFHEVLIKLGQLDDPIQAKETYIRWQEYSTYLQLTNTIADSTASVLRQFFVVGGFASTFLTLLLPDRYRAIVATVALVVLVLSSFTKFLETVSKPLTKLAELKLAKSKKSLIEHKKALTESLSKLRTPIIVVMDDIDRLRKSEIRALLQFVKANVDFPNFIFLLLFQRDIIESSLDEPEVYKGSEYLEKIIQISFNLPQLQTDRVHNILTTGIEKALRSENLFEKFEIVRWHDIFNSGLRDYFTNLRDVKRFLSTLSFHIGSMKIDHVFQVNALDLIALEVLRQFEPGVYDSIHRNKKLFTSGSREHDPNTNKKKEIIIGIVDSSKDPSATKTILLNLFPNIRWAFENYSTSIDSDDYVALRICHPDVFDRYFFLRLPDGDISQADIERAISLSKDREALRLHLLDLQQRSLLPTFLNRFDAHRKKVPFENAVPFITAMFDIGDTFDQDSAGFLTLSSSMYSRRILHGVLQTEPNEGRRKESILEALSATTGTYLPVEWIRSECHRKEKDKYPDAFYFEDSDLDGLKQIGKKLIERAVTNGVLHQSGNLPSILHAWISWDDPIKTKTWVSEYTSNETGLLHFLSSFTQKTYISSGNYKTKTQYSINPSSIENFISFKEIVERTKKLDKSSLNEEDTRSFETVMEANDLLDNPSKRRDPWGL